MSNLDSVRADFRHTVRSLWRDKIFTATVLAIFALCLGANVIIFSIVHAVLLKPLPFPDPEELVTTFNAYPKLNLGNMGSSVPNYFERRAGIKSFAEIAAWRNGSALVGGADSAERVASPQVTPSFFRVLKANAALGRLFTEDEGVEGRTDVVVLDNSYWHRRFRGDEKVIGQTVSLDGHPASIIGVLPAGFRFLGIRSQLWRPLSFSKDDRQSANRHDNSIEILARLKAGVSIAQAQSEMDALNAGVTGKEDPDAAWAKAAGFHTVVAGLQADHVAGVRPVLLLLQAGVGLLLIVGLVNVMSLLLVRASSRAKELAVRQVLGSTWRNLAVQFVAETSMLGFLGGLLGLGLTVEVLPAISRLGADRLQLGEKAAVDVPVAAVAMGVSIVLGLLLAGPLLAFSLKADLAQSLASESRSGTPSRAMVRLRHGLIVVQIALAFVLLSDAALLNLSFRNVLAVQPGFQPKNVIIGWVGLGSNRYRDNAKRFDFIDNWLDSLRGLPGVERVGIGTSVPLNNTSNWAMTVEGHTDSNGTRRAHNVGWIMGDYFEALNVPLREGRFLTAADSRAESRVCIIDDTVARAYWPGDSALGHWIEPGAKDHRDKDAMTVVGVVGTVKQESLTERKARGMVYFPIQPTDLAPQWICVVVRSSQAPESLVPAMRNALHRLDPELPLDGIIGMTSWVEQASSSPRLLTLLFSVLSVMTLLLSAVGVYGILAYAVAQRQKEIGIRMALGALPAQIMRQFLRLGGRVFVAGAIVGAVGAWFLDRTISRFLFGISPTSPLVYFGTTALLAVIVLVACLLPSRRASLVSVTESLRHD